MKERGTTRECFADLMERLQSFPDFHEQRRRLASVLGVEDPAVRRWANESISPVGMSLISLRCYLDFLGYTVEEFTALTPMMQQACKLVAFRVISLEEMTRLTEYDPYTDRVLAILRGVRGVSREREQLFEQVVMAYKNELSSAQGKLPRLVVFERIETKEVKKSTVDTAPVVAPVLRVPVTRTARISQAELFRGLLVNLLHSAEYYFQDSVSEKEREDMRDVVGQANIFELKNMLSRLCSSKAFNNR